MIAFLVMTGLNVVWSQGKEPLQQAVERGLNRADAQSRILAEAQKEQPGALPRSFEKGNLETIRYDHWVSGFFPGVLWMLYENSQCKDSELRRYAEMYTDRVELARSGQLPIVNRHQIKHERAMMCGPTIPSDNHI